MANENTTKLCDHVCDDIMRFLEQNTEFFFNERDFQMHLALFLKNSKYQYDDVDVEYAIPLDEIKDLQPIAPMQKVYPWETELRIDIVVRKEYDYCPIELKYKTKSIDKNYKIERFGEQMLASKLVKNQSAKDLGCYAFWKDVYRLELLQRRFKNIQHGISVFLTNDETYTKPPRDANVEYYNYNMATNPHTTHMIWNTNEDVSGEYVGFELKKEYITEWKTVTYQQIPCYYTMVII